MSADADLLRTAFSSIEVNADFTEAMLRLRDDSTLSFRHRVGQRTASANLEDSIASAVLARISRFRLNGKHLELYFADGGSWEVRFASNRRATDK
jgi:hypothetical protein